MTFPTRFSLLATAAFWTYVTAEGWIELLWHSPNLSGRDTLARVLMLIVTGGTAGILVRCAFGRRPFTIPISAHYTSPTPPSATDSPTT